MPRHSAEDLFPNSRDRSPVSDSDRKLRNQWASHHSNNSRRFRPSTPMPSVPIPIPAIPQQNKHSHVAIDTLDIVRYEDIPWINTDADINRLYGSYHNAALFWHTDRFTNRFGSKLDPIDRARIMNRVNATMQIINEFYHTEHRV